ncbi:acylphosphatase [archaeon]|nr:acylphosphatase [archaeon]
MMKRRVIIKGDKVQDVGYRLFLLEVAESFGLKGFQARNVENYVEFLIEGEEKQVTAFIKFAKTNYPEFAKVEAVVDEDYDGNVMSIEGFYRSFSLNQLVKIVNTGISMLGRQDLMLEKQGSMLEKQDALLEKQDKMLGKQDLMLGKMDLMLEKQDKMLEKQDKMLEKQDILINEVKDLRKDLKAYMEERFQKIELEIARIKEKIGIK